MTATTRYNTFIGLHILLKCFNRKPRRPSSSVTFCWHFPLRLCFTGTKMPKWMHNAHQSLWDPTKALPGIFKHITRGRLGKMLSVELFPLNGQSIINFKWFRITSTNLLLNHVTVGEPRQIRAGYYYSSPHALPLRASLWSVRTRVVIIGFFYHNQSKIETPMTCWMNRWRLCWKLDPSQHFLEMLVGTKGAMFFWNTIKEGCHLIANKCFLKKKKRKTSSHIRITTRVLFPKYYQNQ